MPRVLPKDAPPDVRAGLEQIERDHAERHARILSPYEPYVRNGPYSYFRDLLRVHRHEQRSAAAADSPLLRGLDPGEDPTPIDRGDSLAAVQERLSRYRVAHRLQEGRDIGVASGDDFLRPSAPGWIADIYGQAARQVGRIADALERAAVEPGMVDTSSGVAVIKIPRLSGGAAVAVQASNNAALQETDPTTTSYSGPVGTIAGQVDMSTQLFERSEPRLDEAVAEDLGRATGVSLDAQLVTGSGASGQIRGFQNVASILSGTSAATTVQGQVSALWAGFRTLSGTTGFGSPDVGSYLVLVSPGRFAWWAGGSGSAAIPGELRLPGRVVLSGAVPEGEAYIVDRSSVILVGGENRVRVFDEVGSATLTVQVRSHASAALLVKSPLGIYRLSGLPAMTF
jgi:hypothetical protein